MAGHRSLEQVSVRGANPADADLVCALIAALSAEEGMDPPALTPALFRLQGFGDHPLFTCLIAERDGRPAGLALLTRGYDSQSATGGLVLENLYVEPGSRRSGVGRALLTASARLALADGLGWLSWHARPANLRAALFYRALGAATEPVTLMGISGDDLTRLAGG